MTRRYAETAEKVELLIDALEENGVLSAEWAEALRAADGPGDARHAKEERRAGRGPPDWASGQQPAQQPEQQPDESSGATGQNDGE